MLCRKKLTPRRRRLRKYIALTLAVLTAALIWFEYAVKAQLGDIIVREMHTLSEQAVNDAVADFLSENPDIGSGLADIAYNSGAVSSISLDPTRVNRIKTDITRRAQAYIDTSSRTQGVSAHIGSFTGLVLLTNAGPVVHMPVESDQTVSCTLESRFDSAGLNQTLHHVTLTVTVELLVYNPFKIRRTVVTQTSCEIAQTVIVGAVPSYGGVLTY